MKKTTPQWRDKYLKLLDQHEMAEKDARRQIAIVARALREILPSARGASADLDKVLDNLQQRLSNGNLELEQDIAKFRKLLPKVAGSRSALSAAATHNLDEVAQLLDGSEVPRKLRQRVKELKSSAPKSLSYHASREAWTTELLELSRQLADCLAADRPRQGFWQKWFGGSSEAPLASSFPDQDEVLQGEVITVEECELDFHPNEAPQAAEGSVPALPPRLQPTLLGWLDPKVLPQDYAERSAELRARIEGELAIDDLVPVLEEIRDIYMAFANPVEFETFLAQLAEQLVLINQWLHGQAEVDEAGRELRHSVREQAAQLSSSLQDEQDLETLKRSVADQVAQIQAALERYEERVEPKDGDDDVEAMRERIRELEQQAELVRLDLAEQTRLATTDPLTGLPNREAWNQRAPLEYARWQRYHAPLSAAVADIDLFKQVNDRFGHLAGDRVLKVVAKLIRQRLRDTDFACRFGGEEFVILMPDTSLENACQAMNNLREGLAKCPFHFRKQPVALTISIGVASFCEGDSIEAVVERADQALYQAKDEGRNRVCSAEQKGSQATLDSDTIGP